MMGNLLLTAVAWNYPNMKMGSASESIGTCKSCATFVLPEKAISPLFQM